MEMMYRKLPLVPAFGRQTSHVRDYPLEQLEQRVTRAEYKTVTTELTVIMLRISPNKRCGPLVASDASRAWNNAK
jgi:hypothetical protein